MKRLLFFITLFSCAASLSFTAKKNAPVRSVEGRISYTVSYPKDSMVMGMPDQAVFLFKDQKSLLDFTGGMGLVHLQLIAFADKHNGIQTFTLMDKKYVSDLTQEKISERNKNFFKSLEPAEGTKKIAGFDCKKIKGTLTNGTTVEVWYAPELGGENINWCTPYNEVKGALMEYVLQDKGGPLTKLTASEVTITGVSDGNFSVPDDFQKISIDAQENILKELYPTK